MMVLCQRGLSGFQPYYRCLACGRIHSEESHDARAQTIHKHARTIPTLKLGNWHWKAATATILATIALVSVMQIPVPVRVFATEVSVDPIKDILPYVQLVNFTMAEFSLNYTEGQTMLRVLSDYATVTSAETAQNVTTYNLILGKALVNYQDARQTLNMGFATLQVTITVRYQELVAHIDGTAYMPLWTAIVKQLTGQTT
jgi:hypothetical protein